MKNIMVLFCLLSLLTACGKGDKVKGSSPLPKVVSYTTIKSINNDKQSEFSGKIKSSIETDISFRVPGTINEKYVFLGDTVEKGQVLARLDDSEYQIDYEKSIANLKKAEAQLLNAKQNYNRVKILYFNDDAAKSEYDSAVATLDSSKAEYQAALKEESYSKVQLSYTKLTSLTNGYISVENKELGETVKTGETIYGVVSSNKLEVKFSVPEQIINDISLGSIIEVRVDAINNKSFQAKITNIGSSSVDYGNTFPIEATLLNTPKVIKSGMSSKVYLKNKSKKDILIPLRAVMTDPDNKNYVFKVINIANNMGTLKKVYISTGDINSGGICILSGVTPGDIIVTAGMSKASTGEVVEVMKEDKI